MTQFMLMGTEFRDDKKLSPVSIYTKFWTVSPLLKYT